MAYRDLREFIQRLEQQGQVRRIRAPVSPNLEITEITDRVSKGPAAANFALLFEHVHGSTMPVLTNAFGSAQRMAWALGVEQLDDLTANLERMLVPEIPGSLVGKLRRLGDLLDVARAGPRMVKDAPCQEVIQTDSPSLEGLPILKCWPDDGGRYITLPAVITRDPATGRRNVGMYRLQVFDERTLGMHWQRHKGGAEHEREGRRLGESRLEAAIALGGDPAITYCASAPLPQGVDEMLLAGWLRGRGVDMVRCVSVDLEVPADAEIVLEGYVDLGERRLEGPFGDHTGYYSLAGLYPVFHLTALTRRRDAIYPATVVGRPPMEDYWMGKATERLFLPLVRLMLPDVVDMNMPAEGVFHNMVIVSVRKRYPGHVRSIMYGLWGLGLLMLAKNLIVVDEHVNVHDLSEVAWRVGNSVDPARDLVLAEGPVDDLDHASLRPGYGGKLGIDATAKDSGDGFDREWPREIVMSQEVKRLVEDRWSEYGL
ncbi:MAG: menaquinone biosynthesis decarboxylase [Anaerolineae bacterium]|nr:menaquinone biosynthesis decarboxylase [Anaerolineae bacterium]